jgi:hypothetical protein
MVAECYVAKDVDHDLELTWTQNHSAGGGFGCHGRDGYRDGRQPPRARVRPVDGAQCDHALSYYSLLEVLYHCPVSNRTKADLLSVARRREGKSAPFLPPR